MIRKRDYMLCPIIYILHRWSLLLIIFHLFYYFSIFRLRLKTWGRIIACVSRQPNFYLLRQPQYRLEIVFPGSHETRQPWSKNPKINFKLIFISRLSCFAATERERERILPCLPRLPRFTRGGSPSWIAAASWIVAAVLQNKAPRNRYFYTVPKNLRDK